MKATFIAHILETPKSISTVSVNCKSVNSASLLIFGYWQKCAN